MTLKENILGAYCIPLEFCKFLKFIFRFITQISKKDQSANTIKLSFSVKVNDHYMLENTSIHWIGVGSHAGSNMLGVAQDFIQIFKVKYYIYSALDSTAAFVIYLNKIILI